MANTIWTRDHATYTTVKFDCPECGTYIKGVAGLDGRCRACDASVTGPEFPEDFWK